MRPMAAAVTPLPTELTTPPVRKMNLDIKTLSAQKEEGHAILGDMPLRN
jgi:hypothetical protein